MSSEVQNKPPEGISSLESRSCHNTQQHLPVWVLQEHTRSKQQKIVDKSGQKTVTTVFMLCSSQLSIHELLSSVSLEEEKCQWGY